MRVELVSLTQSNITAYIIGCDITNITAEFVCGAAAKAQMCVRCCVYRTDQHKITVRIRRMTKL